MHALEDEPESGDRLKRLAIGGAISAVVLVLLGYGAQRFEPARKLMQRVVEMTVVTELPKLEKLPPPRSEPPPPPPKRAPPPRKTAAKTAAPPKSTTPQPQTSEPQVGLDGDSFGSGEGASYQVGNTQLGEPTTIARAPSAAPAAPAPRPMKVVPAGIPARAERCRYSQRAQRLGLEGLMVIEVDIDREGRVTDAEVRKPLEAEIDRECLEGVRMARFDPATLDGRAIASTRFLRLRFELDR